MAGQAPSGIGRGRRLLVLGICSMSLLIVGLDLTIVNVALPSIHRDLRSSVSGLQWTVDAYTLVIASAMMLAGSTADRVGRRRIFQVGLVAFSLGSLACGLAPSLGFLVAARVVQGIGAAMLNPVAMSIIRNTFTDPRERAQAIGVWNAVFGLSLALGPVLGGVLIQTVSWRAVFFVNIPIGVAAILLTVRYVPESHAERHRRPDPVAQLLVIAGLGALTFAIIEGPRAGWASAQTLGVFTFALACLMVLVPYELRRPEPLLEMRFFASVPFSGASAIAVLAFTGLGGFMFMNTLYLQDVRLLSPFHAGLCTLPMAAMIIGCSPAAGRLVERRGARLPMLTAAGAMLAGALMLTQVTPGTALTYLLGSFALYGLAEAMINPPITDAAITGMPPAQAGVASAIASTSRQTGMTLGVAVMGAVSGASTAAAIGKGFASATHPGWWITAALAVIIIVLTLLATSRWAISTAHRTAAGFDEN
jgi:EmrB/QacA subfamily drug resistance transporter